MLTIYKCIELASDESGSHDIGLVSTEPLAKLVTFGKGPGGFGNGKIEPVQVWETVEDLPEPIRKRVQEKCSNLTGNIEELAEKTRELSQILDIPANTVSILETAAHLESQREAMLALRDKLNDFLGKA